MRESFPKIFQGSKILIFHPEKNQSLPFLSYFNKISRLSHFGTILDPSVSSPRHRELKTIRAACLLISVCSNRGSHIIEFCLLSAHPPAAEKKNLTERGASSEFRFRTFLEMMAVLLIGLINISVSSILERL